jgi:hypothetical protein
MIPAILVFLSFLLSQTSQPPTVTIHGKILQSTTNQPIRKVSIHIYSNTEPSPQNFLATSDADGAFTLENVLPGLYAVLLQRPGFVPSAVGRASYIIVQSDSSTPLILYMQPAAVIVGKILDPEGDPLRGVSVTATSLNRRADSLAGTDFTNDLGEFRIAGLRPGSYIIAATPPPSSNETPIPNQPEPKPQNDHSINGTTYYPGTLTNQDATPLELHSGDETRITFSILTTHAYHISGSVTGIPAGSAITQIMLESPAGTTIPPSELQNGKFQFPDVVPGTYTPLLITATFADGQPHMQMSHLGQPIQVINSDIEDLHLQPEPGGQLRGRFHLDTNQKFDFTQLQVTLISADSSAGSFGRGFPVEGGDFSGISGVSTVGADGTFILKNVAGGTYYLAITAKSNNLRDYFTKSITLDGRDVSDFGIPIHSDTRIDVVLSANGASVFGTVVDAQGQPVPDATVIDVPAEPHQSRPDLYQRTATDANGHFALRGLNPGKYVVFAFEELTEDPRQPNFLKSNPPQSQPIRLEESSHITTTLTVIPAPQ